VAFKILDLVLNWQAHKNKALQQHLKHFEWIFVENVKTLTMLKLRFIPVNIHLKAKSQQFRCTQYLGRYKNISQKF